MPDSFIPSQEAAALTWMQAFASGISANCALYLLTTADALAIQSAVDSYAAALAYIGVPAQKSKVSVAAKDDARTAAEQICRQYASIIKPNAGISDPDKINIGVRPPNPSREPIGPPTSSPMVAIFGATQGSQTLRYADSNTPDSPAKPFGVSQLQLFVAIGEEAASNPDTAKFYGLFTKNPIGVGFSSLDNGKQATYFARWCNLKGQTGPWSFPVSMAIAA